jgi:hypothetical protein
LVCVKETNDLPVKSEKSPISKTTRSVRLPSQCNIGRNIGTKVRILQLLAHPAACPWEGQQTMEKFHPLRRLDQHLDESLLIHLPSASFEVLMRYILDRDLDKPAFRRRPQILRNPKLSKNAMSLAEQFRQEGR